MGLLLQENLVGLSFRGFLGLPLPRWDLAVPWHLVALLRQGFLEPPAVLEDPWHLAVQDYLGYPESQWLHVDQLGPLPQ